MGASQSQTYEDSNTAMLVREEHGGACEHQVNKTVETNHDAKPNEKQAAVVEKTSRQQKLPHNCQEILKEADSKVLDWSSSEKLKQQLCDGVLLDNGRKMYWINKNSESNCFTLHARALSITWSEEPQYWRWLTQNVSCDKSIEVAELLNVCWLEVHGKFETRHLSPGALYEVAFVVMLKDPAYGWDIPVNLRLVLPNGNKRELKETLLQQPRAKWIEIPVGEYMASGKENGELEFSMHEYHGGQWKRGLVIKGVSIKAKP